MHWEFHRLGNYTPQTKHYILDIRIPIIYSSIMRGIGNTDLSDRVIVDFSPLREKNVSPLVAICEEEASKYTSKVASVDNSNLDGWLRSLKKNRYGEYQFFPTRQLFLFDRIARSLQKR